MIEIRLLTEADAGAFREVRLRALREELLAFTSSSAEFSHQSLEQIAARLRPDLSESFVVGGFSPSQLVGMVGFYRPANDKTRHKGNIWGMYVVPEVRGQGVGKALLSEVIARARSIAGVEQLLLGVMVTQTTARQLYASLGFVVYGHEPRAVKVNDQFFDEELMVLDLREDK